MFTQTAARTVRLRAAITLLAAVALCAMAGEARAADLPNVAVTPAGVATFVWQTPLYNPVTEEYDQSVIRSRTRNAAGTLGTTVDISESDKRVANAQVAVAPNGDARFVWLKDIAPSITGYPTYVVQTRKRFAAGNLGAIETLSAAGPYVQNPKVAVDPAGNAVVVWSRTDDTSNRIESRSISAAGTLSGVRTLSTTTDDTEPQVAMDANGRSTFAWARRTSLYTAVIETRTLTLVGALSPNTWLTQSTALLEASRPRLALDGDGDAVFTWTRIDDNGTSRVQTRTRSVAGVLGVTRTLSGAGSGAYAPELDVSPAGRAVFTWVYTNPANWVSMVQTRSRAADGTLSATKNLTGAAGPSAYLPEVGVDQDGDASFIYAQDDPIWERARSRTLSAAGVLTGVLTMSGTSDASRTGLAVDQDGDTTFVWKRGGAIEARWQSNAGVVSGLKTIGF